MNNTQLLYISQKASKALYYEVSLSPKPGLVDRFDNGAHNDMDFYTFINSIESLRPFFYQYIKTGFYHQKDLNHLFDQLRQIGQAAEQAMLQSTQGVNTHKGANFSFAVILGATGYYVQNHSFPFTAADSQAILTIVAEMTKQAMAKDFTCLNKKKSLSYGEKLYSQKGLTGVRGEAAQGYPVLNSLLLPFLRSYQKHTDSVETYLLRALVLLMSEVEDGNIIHRGGISAWYEHKEKSRVLHQKELSSAAFKKELAKYNQELIRKNLSPGGAADLLGLGIYFSLLEKNLDSIR